MDKYLRELRNFKHPNPNFNKLEEKILVRAKKEKLDLFPKLALVGGLAVIILTVGIYFNSNYGQNDSIIAYVMDQDSNYSADPILDYVFED